MCLVNLIGAKNLESRTTTLKLISLSRILRDLYERLISQFFFLQKNGKNFKKTGVPGVDLETYLRTNKFSFLDHFPRYVTIENYKDICEEFFVEIGITEKLDESLARIARKLGFKYEGKAPHVNKTQRDGYVPSDIKDQFYENHRLEYEVYEYALSKFMSEH